MALQLSEGMTFPRSLPRPVETARGTAAPVTVRGLTKAYGDNQVLRGIDLDIRAGESVGIIGRSGCGKSTLLRLIAGLETPTGGTIQTNGQPIRGLNTQARMMFQDARLLPWKRVWENVTLGLSGLSGREKRERALQVLEQVGLPNRGEDWPTILSGGQKQRVALARALATQPPLLLLDEPLGALDALTRLEMQALMEGLWKAQGFTSVLVTHDVEEAVALCDRVILLAAGEVAMDISVPFAHPRLRTGAAFTEFKEAILERVLERRITG